MSDNDLYVLTYDQLNAIFDEINRMATTVDYIVSNAIVVPSESQLIQDLTDND